MGAQLCFFSILRRGGASLGEPGPKLGERMATITGEMIEMKKREIKAEKKF